MAQPHKEMVLGQSLAFPHNVKSQRGKGGGNVLVSHYLFVVNLFVMIPIGKCDRTNLGIGAELLTHNS
ncbi:hypothetical protein [Nostoc sp.]|uniref:hypothetical protein n=1 Tax=Nostoc sp. TaxID=1180 RepID=UPI002FFCC22C